MDELKYILENLSKYKDAFTAIRDISLIGIGLASLWFLNIRSKALKKSALAAEKQAKTSLKNTKISNRQQISDQYIKAVDQLGSNDLCVCLGGIYGLEQVAKISEDFSKQIVEVLTGFIRSNTDMNLTSTKETKNKKVYMSTQAALDVIGRRSESMIGPVVGLNNCDLSGLVFRGDFALVDLENCNLSECVFDKADMLSLIHI